MHRPDTEGAVAGQFSDGTPPLVLGTVLGADFMNDQMENLIKLIEDAGGALIKGDYGQVKDAVLHYVGTLKTTANTWIAHNIFAEGATFSRTTADSRAVGGTGNGTGYGAEFTGGASGGGGVRGTGGGAGPGVVGVTVGAGEALIGDATAGTGYGLLAAGNATRGNIRASPLSVAPSVKENGASYCDTSGRWFAATADAWYPIGSRTATIQTNTVGNVDATEADLHTAQIPAKQLIATPLVRIAATGEIVASVALKFLRIYVGGTLVLTCNMPNNTAAHYFVRGEITRKGPDEQRVMISVTLINFGTETMAEAYSAIANLTADEDATIDVKTTGQDGATPNSIQEHYFSIEYP